MGFRLTVKGLGLWVKGLELWILGVRAEELRSGKFFREIHATLWGERINPKS